MKKILSLLMALTLVISMFALASCDNNDDGNPDVDAEGLETLNGKTPEQIYGASMEAIKLADEYEIVSNQVIKMGYEGESFTMNQRVVSKIDGDNSYSKITDDMSNQESETWYVDGVVYAKEGNNKIKTNLDKEEYMQQYMGKDPTESTLLDIPESWFKDIRFFEKDGLYTMEFVISAEEYNELFANLGLGVASVNDDVVYTVYFDKGGNLSKIITEFTINVQGFSADCVSTSDVTLTDVTVTAPADADSYTYVELN